MIVLIYRVPIHIAKLNSIHMYDNLDHFIEHKLLELSCLLIIRLIIINISRLISLTLLLLFLVFRAQNCPTLYDLKFYIFRGIEDKNAVNCLKLIRNYSSNKSSIQL